MAVSPKDLIKSTAANEKLLAKIEEHIDTKLREHEIEAGKTISISFEEPLLAWENAGEMTSGTAKAIKRLYTKAGWHDVGVNTTHSILTMSCPRWRGRGRGEPEEPGSEG